MIARWRNRQPDTVANTLKGLARQGSHIARVANMCAFLLIILFSAGSLVALSGAELEAIIVGWPTIDVPSVISVAVSTLLVLAMDTAMVSATGMSRNAASKWVRTLKAEAGA